MASVFTCKPCSFIDNYLWTLSTFILLLLEYMEVMVSALGKLLIIIPRKVMWFLKNIIVTWKVVGFVGYKIKYTFNIKLNIHSINTCDWHFVYMF